MALLALLVPSLFLLIGFGEITKFSFYQNVSVGLIDLVVLGTIVFWLIYIRKTTYRLLIPIILFASALLLSLFLNIFNYTGSQLLTGLMYFVRLAAYASLYFVFVDIGQRFKNVLPSLMLMTTIVFMAIGFYQYIFFRDLRDYYHLGWDLHVGRIFSSFFDPNFAGVFLVLTFFFILILKRELFVKKWQYFWYIILSLNLLAIILTYSRGAFLALVAGIVSYSVLTKRFKLLGLMLFVFIAFFVFTLSRPNLESTNLLRTASIEARINSSKQALEIWQNNPFGVGFNTLRYAKQKQYNEPGLKNSHAGAGVENSYLFILATSGFLGLTAFGYLLFRIFKLNLSNIRKNNYALVVVVSLISLMTSALFVNSFFYSNIFIWMIILIGFTESIQRE